MKAFPILTLFLLPTFAFCQANKGGLKVFIENAEEDDIIAATVQVMDDGLQVAEGVTDFLGFVYLPNISEGEFDVVIRHISVKSDTFPVNVQHGTICTLQVNLELRYGLLNSGGIGCKLLIEPLNDSVLLKQGTTDKGGLKVFIENAEQDGIVVATVQVMDGEQQVAGGVTGFSGWTYIPAIDPGTYTVVLKHIMIGALTYGVSISSDSTNELVVKAEIVNNLPCICYPPLPVFDSDPFRSTYASDNILRSPSIFR